MSWLSANAEWLFSGIGVTVLLFVGAWVSRIVRERRSRTLGSSRGPADPVELSISAAAVPVQIAHHLEPTNSQTRALTVDSNRRIQTRTQLVVMRLGEYVQVDRYDNTQLRITLRTIGERGDGKMAVRIAVKGELFRPTQYSLEIGANEFELVEGDMHLIIGDFCVYSYKFSEHNFELIRINVEHINAVAQTVEFQVVQIAEDRKRYA